MSRPSLPEALSTVCLVLVLCVASPTSGKSIAWRHDLKQAAYLAAQQHKPLLVKVSATWCGPCKRMQRNTFSDERIATHVNQCFVPVALDGDRDSTLVRSMGVSAYPTTLVLGSDLKLVKRISGYRTPDQFSQDLSGLCNHPHQSDKVSVPGATNPFADWCPVSPVVDGEFAKGNAAFKTTFRGREVWFRDARHRQLFLEDPHRYWPVADGQCVVSWLDEQTARMGQMRFGLDQGGTIWFFASEEHRNRFAANPEEHLRRLTGNRQGTDIAASE